MTIDIDRLIALCEKATPGPWETEQTRDWWMIADKMDAIATTHMCFARNPEANAAFIAACDPQTILALCKKLQHMSALLGMALDVNVDGDSAWEAEVRALIEYPECSGDPACCPENEGYGCCKPNAALCAENKRLTEEVERLRGEGKPIAYGARSVRDGSFLPDTLAWCRWTTFEQDLEKARAHPWVVNKAATIEPLYADPPAHSTSAAAEESVTITEDMLQRAMHAYHCHDSEMYEPKRIPMYAALEAALAAAPGGERK